MFDRMFDTCDDEISYNTQAAMETDSVFTESRWDGRGFVMAEWEAIIKATVTADAVLHTILQTQLDKLVPAAVARDVFWQNYLV